MFQGWREEKGTYICMRKMYLFLFLWTFHWVWVLEFPPSPSIHTWWRAMPMLVEALRHWEKAPGKGVPPHPRFPILGATWPPCPHLPAADSRGTVGHRYRNQDPHPKGGTWATQPATRENALLQMNEASRCFPPKWRQSAAKAMMTSRASCQEAAWKGTSRIKTYGQPAPAMSTCPSSH